MGCGHVGGGELREHRGAVGTGNAPEAAIFDGITASVASAGTAAAPGIVRGGVEVLDTWATLLAFDMATVGGGAYSAVQGFESGDSVLGSVGAVATALGLANLRGVTLQEMEQLYDAQFTPAQDFLVHGTVTTRLNPHATVSVLKNTYNFDIKPWGFRTLGRNVETLISHHLVHGPGVPFDIRFRGTAPIPP